MEIRRIRGWLAQLFGLLNRKRREHEFAEELESHLVLESSATHCSTAWIVHRTPPPGFPFPNRTAVS
jgi:hypothetical protein